MAKAKKNPFSGVIGGIILLVIGTILLWWNEGNNVKNIKTLKEVTKNVVDISSSKVDSQYEGKLVATNGDLITEDEALVDTEFSISINTPKLKRVVEMYQWEENETTDEDNHTTYSYKKVWDEDVINSNTFARSGHDNPNSMEYKSKDFLAQNVKVGAYSLASDQIKMLNANEYLKIENNTTLEGYHIDGNYLTNSLDLDNPQIGDIKISWKYNNWEKASVLAVVAGNTFTDYVSKVGKHVNRVEKGALKSTDFEAKIKDENNLMKWIFRGLGALLIVLGYSSIISLLTSLTRFIPILGGIVGGLLGLVALLVGIVHSLIVIAIAWIRFRPILGISLLAIAVILIVVINMILGKNKKKNQENNIQQANDEVINQ